ncbi:GntR family transcriptional regulator [Desulfohalovibrio reitneri]|uniref:GntR family transcriptional regulator n=1 Tax=Desulfohalovibrio reitneri TaxID=1307759 RepID=UPI0004A722A1|nr:GntR family transcriptional regulator [Desulfohalovibrio reitneri]
MLADLFTSKTRAKLLLKLFLNPQVRCYLRELAGEFGVSPAVIKGELDHLSEAGYLERERNGRSVFFRANSSHPFFPEIHSLVKKHLGIDRVVDQVMSALAPIEAVYILDDYAQGRDSGLIDLLIVGDPDRGLLEGTRGGVEKKINRRIRVHVVSPEDFQAERDMYLSRPHWKVA